MSERKPLYIEKHWELMTIINSYNLKGVNQQMMIYKDIYSKGDLPVILGWGYLQTFEKMRKMRGRVRDIFK